METSKNVNNDTNTDTDPDVNTTSWMIVDNTALEEFLDKNEERSSDSDISVISDTEENCSICQSQAKYDNALPQIQFELQDNSYIKDLNGLGIQSYQDEKNIQEKNDLDTDEVHPIMLDNIVSEEDMQTKTDLIEDLNGTELPYDNDISNIVSQEQENYYLRHIFKRRLLIISGLTIISIILAGFWLNRKNIFTVNGNIHLNYKPNYSKKYIQKCVYSEYLKYNEKNNNMRNLYGIKNNIKRTYYDIETKNQSATILHFINLDNMQKNKIIFDAKYELFNEPQLVKQGKNDEIVTKYHGNNQQIKAKHYAELKMKEMYLNEQDKYLQKKEKYLKKFEKRVKRMEVKIHEYNKRIRKYNQDPCIKHESNKLKNNLKNEQSKIDTTQYPGDWYTKRYYNRAEIRKNEKLSDWFFDRSTMRNKLRNKALWYFERALDRENLRAVGYEYEKCKIHSYCY